MVSLGVFSELAAESAKDLNHPTATSYTYLEQLTTEIYSDLKELERLERHTIQKKLEIGIKLMEAKKKLGHGNFRRWIESQFGAQDWRPRKYMQLARSFKIEDFTDLDVEIVPSAIEFLASPSLGKEVFEEAVVVAREEAQVAGKKGKLTSKLARKVAQKYSRKDKTYQPKNEIFTNLDTSAVPLDEDQFKNEIFTNLDTSAVPLDEDQFKNEIFTNLDTSAVPLDEDQFKNEIFTNLDASTVSSTELVLDTIGTLTASTALLSENSLEMHTTIDVSFEHVEETSDRFNGQELTSDWGKNSLKDEKELKPQIKVTDELKCSCHSTSHIGSNLQDQFHKNCQDFNTKNFTNCKNMIEILTELTNDELAIVFEVFVEKLGIEVIINLVSKQMDEQTANLFQS